MEVCRRGRHGDPPCRGQACPAAAAALPFWQRRRHPL